MTTDKVVFAPQLYIKHGVTDISFYSKAFGAEELRRWSNEDGSIHVAELSIGGTLFNLHEASEEKGLQEPGQNNGTTVAIGLFVPDVNIVMNKAIGAGAIEISRVTDYEYGYRQGIIKDPFGHEWIIQARI
ncbi:VOC family protein [Chitinophagaceae bacterium MMS25-I14]